MTINSVEHITVHEKGIGTHWYRYGANWSMWGVNSHNFNTFKRSVLNFIMIYKKVTSQIPTLEM